jgi:hypothetical protein
MVLGNVDKYQTNPLIDINAIDGVLPKSFIPQETRGIDIST